MLSGTLKYADLVIPVRHGPDNICEGFVIGFPFYPLVTT